MPRTKKRKEIETNLLCDIDTLEKNLGSDNYDLYLEKKAQLQTIRERSIKGHQIRSNG